MATLQKLTLFGLILSFFFGQLFRVNMFGISLLPLDIFLVLFTLVNIPQFKKTSHPFFYFFIFSLFSLFLNFFIYHFRSVTPFFYLFRLGCLLLLLIFPPEVTPIFKRFFILSLTANIIFGLIQYFVWPDFTYFNAFNWDPHLYRLVSTFFDPTFTGLIYLMFLIYLFLNFSKFPRLVSSFLFLVSYFALALTYSRSSLLCFVVAALFLSFKKHQFKYFLGSIVIILATIFLLPRNPGEGSKLERTSSISAKIVNYQEGFKMFTTSPIYGVGYNNLVYLRPDTSNLSHALSGFDGSLLTILVTTGVIGFVLFVLGLKKLYLSYGLLHQTLLIVLLVHSLFANSLLYPWSLLFLILI